MQAGEIRPVVFTQADPALVGHDNDRDFPRVGGADGRDRAGHDAGFFDFVEIRHFLDHDAVTVEE